MLDEPSRLVLEELAAQPAAMPRGTDSMRQRLIARAAHSVAAAGAFHTVRGAPRWVVGDGLRWRWLYRAHPGRPLRPGEPLRVRQIELAPGIRCALTLEDSSVRCEWLVMSGDVCVEGMPLLVRDYHVVAACARIELLSAAGARVYLREAEHAGGPLVQHTARDRQMPWVILVPGVERRVMWQRGREAALMYRVQPGLNVPHHGHGHDEECLLLEGEVFVDDILLCGGEYQLAPAGTHHEGVSSDVGGILFAHGDIELDVTAR